MQSASSVNLGPPHISKTIIRRNLKFYKRLGSEKYSFLHDNFSARGVRGRSPHLCKFGIPLISQKLLELESWKFTHT